MDVDLEFPTLDTPRLHLRELNADDLNPFFQIFTDPEVTQFYNIPTFKRKAEARQLLQKRIERFYTKKGICWAIVLRNSKIVIGTCGFNAWYKHRQVGDLGYELARPYWNQGIMTEALTAIMRYGFEELGLVQQRAWVMPKNKASARVLEKIGFRSQGIQFARGYWDSQFHDLELFTATVDNPPKMTFPI